MCMGVVTVTTVGKGAEHGRERQKRLLHMALANKHRCVLGKDFCHRKWILLSLTLRPTYTLLLLRELAFLVLFAPLLASRRPDKRRRYKFCGWKKRNALSITRKQYRPDQAPAWK
jgi:hypothetical protein